MNVWNFTGYIKSKSRLMMDEQFGELKFKCRSREVSCPGSYVETGGKNNAKIQHCIKQKIESDTDGHPSACRTSEACLRARATEMQISGRTYACRDAVGKKA